LLELDIRNLNKTEPYTKQKNNGNIYSN